MRPASINHNSWSVAAVLACLVWSAHGHAELPDYQPAQNVAGSLTSVGSDTLRVVVQQWGDAFAKLYPDIRFDMEAEGSATGPVALTEGRSNLAPMSREMNDAEVEAYERAFGYEPTAVRVALDALAVYVHKDNPIRGLTLEQLDGIFSADQACGGDAITAWGDVLLGAIAEQPIMLYGRNALSGTHDYFQSRVLCDGAFNDRVQEQPSSEAVVEAVGASINAIGYSGLGYRADSVRPIAISRGPDEEDDPYYTYLVEQWRDDPDLAKRYAYVIDGRYPLSRFLYLYVDKAPDKPLEPAIEEFVKFALSSQGQAIVHEIGYVPLTEQMVEEELAKLQADYEPSWWSFD